MRKNSLWCGLAAAMVLMGVCAGTALAQEGTDQQTTAKPPTPRKSDDPPFMWNVLAVVVIAGSILGANMIPSKRGHQD